MLNEIDLSRTDLNLLVVFDAVARERHVGRAARKLNLTPSAVSHGLGRLRRLLNDPLFVRTPRGVVPTERAAALTEPVADLLAAARNLLESAEPFDPSRATRRFMIGAPDGVASVFLSALLARVQAEAPGVSIGIRQLLPDPGERGERAWGGAFREIEARGLDVAIIPSGFAPASFETRALFQEDFVVAMRAGHPFAQDPTLARYCEMQHLVVSTSGDPEGFVDQVLAGRGLARRVVATVPSFMFALSVLSETDLVCALPRRFVAQHEARFGLVGVEPPTAFGEFELHAVTSRAAAGDKGIAWLVATLETAAR